MCRKVYIPTLNEGFAECAVEHPVVEHNKPTLLFAGQEVAIVNYDYFDSTTNTNVRLMLMESLI